MKRTIVFFLAVISMSTSFGQKKVLFTTNDYVNALKHATDVMVNDVTSPVAAARYYAYITLSANETAALFNNRQLDFGGIVKGLSNITIDDSLIKKSDSSLAIILALYKSASKLLPSGYLLQKNIEITTINKYHIVQSTTAKPKD